MYGFTATPVYGADKNCAQVFGKIIDSITISEGVRNHLLCGVKNGLLVASVPLDLTGIKNSSGDYDEEKLMEAIAKVSPRGGVKQAIVDYYFEDKVDISEQIRGKITIINVPNQREANELAQMMNERAGYTIAKAYHSRSSDEVLQEFNRGDFPVLIQVNRLTEGYNNPKVEVCINYPTASYVRATQRGGRVLRYDPENHLKLALVLDIAFMQSKEGNIYAEIAKNGQVLFKDIAEDYYITSDEYERTREKDEANNKKREMKDVPEEKSQTEIAGKETEKEISFIAKTCLGDLFIINWGYEKYKEQNSVDERKGDDICLSELIRRYEVRTKDGQRVVTTQKSDIFRELIENKELWQRGIIAIKKTASGNIFPFIIGDKIKELNQISDYIISIKDEEQNVPSKKQNDIGYKEFRDKCSVYSNKREITKKQKVILFRTLVKNQELWKRGIIALRKPKNSKGYPCIIGDKLEEFMQSSGYDVIYKDDVPSKKENDIGNTDFMNIKIYAKNGEKLTTQQKKEIFKKLINDKMLLAKGIIAIRKESGGKHPCIIGDKLKEFTQISSYRIVSLTEELHELQKQAAEAKTPKERRKYLAEAKKIFERLNPKLKKGKVCSECIKKVSGERE